MYGRIYIYCTTLLTLVSDPWRAGLEGLGRWEGFFVFILYASVLKSEFYDRRITFTINVFCKIWKSPLLEWAKGTVARRARRREPMDAGRLQLCEPMVLEHPLWLSQQHLVEPGSLFLPPWLLLLDPAPTSCKPFLASPSPLSGHMLDPWSLARLCLRPWIHLGVPLDLPAWAFSNHLCLRPVIIQQAMPSPLPPHPEVLPVGSWLSLVFNDTYFWLNMTLKHKLITYF